MEILELVKTYNMPIILTKLVEYLAEKSERFYRFIFSNNQKEFRRLLINICEDVTRWKTHYLPCMAIPAGLYAARCCAKRQPQQGDGLDFIHASQALPYCDYFLTEKQMGTVLTQGPLNYDKHYNCKVLWKPEVIYETLKSI